MYENTIEVGKEYIEKWNNHELIQAVPGGLYWFNILQKKVDKGVALRELMDMYNIAPEEVIAIGDNMNDITMLNAADLSIAVDNARQEVKCICDKVIPSNMQDGVANYLLNEYKNSLKAEQKVL